MLGATNRFKTPTDWHFIIHSFFTSRYRRYLQEKNDPILSPQMFLLVSIAWLDDFRHA